MKEIFTALLGEVQQGRDAMLATMVAHAGSVPRGMGSQMVLGHSGRIAGTIGGGVGEKEMLRLGTELLAKRQCGLHTYALHGRTGEQLGSVCGGDITVYFQFVPAGDALWMTLCEKLLELIRAQRRGWLIQQLDTGVPALLDEDETLAAGEVIPDTITLCKSRSVFAEHCFSMPLNVGERVILFGAGHCAQALTPLLASVGFRVTVYDSRPELACEALLPQAERIICAPFDQIADHIALTQEDYIVAMSSTHVDDLCIQRQVLSMEHAYTGMMGSRPKRAFINSKLLEYGIAQERIDRVHTPVGLNIKAVTPAEIAISIAAEMVLVRAQNREKRST